MALTTLENVKLILGITGTAQDARLTALLNAASARIESMCNRYFEATDVVEWHDGGFALTARRAPVNSVKRIGIVDGSAFTVRYSGADVAATVSATPGVVTLWSSTVGKTSITATGTLAAVVTAINAVSGWEATADGALDGAMAAWIPPVAGQDAKDTDASVPVAMGTLPISRFDPDSGVVEYATSGQYAAFGVSAPYSGWGIQMDKLVEADGKADFPTVYQGIVIEYNGGWGTVPADVQMVCVDMVQYMLQSANAQSLLLNGESIGGYSYTNASGGSKGGIAGVLSGFDALMRERLAAYIRLPLTS